MSEVNRYVVDQAKVYMDTCQEDKSYQSEDSEQQSMIVITSNNLIESQLTEISIKGNKNFRFTDDLVTLMVEGLTKSNISLTTLALTHHRINDVGFIQLCRLILPSGDMTGLQSLDVEGNNIGPIGCSALSECLVSSDCALVSICLSCNPLKAKGGMALAEALERNVTLQSVDLANCDLSLTSLIAIATSLYTNTNISSLSLDRPLLTSPGDDITHTLSALVNSPSLALESLSLKYCRLSDMGTTLLSRELLSNRSLLLLNLECNCIGVRGAECLASYLIQVNQLQSLLLSCNSVSDDGAVALAQALRSNTSLLELSLRSNGIHLDGLIALGNSLYKNATLQFLSLWGNEFEDASCQLFGQIFEAKEREKQIQRKWHAEEGEQGEEDGDEGLRIDLEVYEVDGVHYVAEKTLN